MARRYSQY